MRAFIAIELPEAVRLELAELRARLKGSGIRARWTAPQSMHLTLRFLGEVTEAQAEAIQARLSQCYAAESQFTLVVAGVGAFPNTGRPSVVWAGVTSSDGDLERVQAAAEAVCRGIGLEPETRAYHPHITLGRLREPRNGGPLSEVLAREADFEGGAFTATGATLFESALSPEGAVHTVRGRMPFGAGEEG